MYDSSYIIAFLNQLFQSYLRDPSFHTVDLFNNHVITLLYLDSWYNCFQSCQRPPMVVCLGL